MSWDKYNEARKKAREATKKAKDVSEGKEVTVTKSEIAQVKTAYKNAKKYKWAFVTFVIIAILALATLPFSTTLEFYANSWVYGTHNNLDTQDEFNSTVQTVQSVTDNSQVKVHYVDVGQGDCIMIDLPDGKNIIIDSGSETYNSTTSQKVINYISNILLQTGEIIDYLILTHPDSDHVFYMPDILDNFEVATIYRPYCFYNVKNASTASAEEKELAQKEQETIAKLNNDYNYGITLGDVSKDKTNAKSTQIMYNFVSRIYTETYGGQPASMKFPIAGEKITGTGYSLTFYAPINPATMYSSWNNYSSVMVLDYEGTKMAFTGDAEKLEEKEILANVQNLALPDIDIMDMGHHGSRTSSHDAFIKALKPEYAIISCGLDNKYKHPNQETLDTLKNNGVDANHIFITAQSGDIVVGLGYTAPSESGVVEASTEAKFAISCSGEKSFLEITSANQEYIKWWYIVFGVIVLAGIVLLIVIPNAIKSIKKATK